MIRPRPTRKPTPAQRRAVVRARAALVRANRNAERRFVVQITALLKGLHAEVMSAVEGPAKAAADAGQPKTKVDAKGPNFTGKGWTHAGFVEASKAVDVVAKRVIPQFAPKVSAAHQRLTAELLTSYDQAMRGVLPLGFDKLPSLVQSQAHVARDRSIGLVENAGRVYARQVRAIFDDPTQTQGVRWEDLKAKLVDRADVSNSRAELIARDQTLKLAGAINMARQTANGITHYTWSTSLDERVRETHAELEGQSFAWNAPPPEAGNPGDDFQCRCVAIPEIDGAEWGAVEVE